jgi:hypothetical protein
MRAGLTSTWFFGRIHGLHSGDGTLVFGYTFDIGFVGGHGLDWIDWIRGDCIVYTTDEK